MGRNPVALSPNGRSQVENAARLVKLLNPDVIISSPLARARESAEIVAAHLQSIDIFEEPEIAEVLYGRWEGKTYHDLIEDEYYKEYRKSPIHHPTPGGETIPEVQARGVRAISNAFARHPGKRILFVSHGDIIRTVLCHFLGLDLVNFHRLRVDNAAISAIQITAEFAELKLLNLLPDPGRAFISPFETSRRPAQPDPNTSKAAVKS